MVHEETSVERGFQKDDVKQTVKDKDYEVYKEALNAATNEVRKYKRNFEHNI